MSNLPKGRKYKKIKIIIGICFIANGFYAWVNPVWIGEIDGYVSMFSLFKLAILAFWVIPGSLIIIGWGQLRDKNRWK